MLNRTITAEQMHKLRVFVAIVDGGSMTVAAGTLGLSRSVVSGHLSTLEASLGVTLIERTTRSMSVTHIGQQVYKASQQMLAAGQTALELVDQHLGSVRGVIRVASAVDLAPALLTPVIVSLRQQYPELTVTALTSDRRVDIVQDRIDVALRIGFPADSTAILHMLAKTKEVIVASPSLTLPSGLQKPSGLTSVPRIAHDAVDMSRMMLNSANESVDIEWPTASVTASSSDVVRDLTIRGVGFSILPEIIVRQDLDEGRLVQLLPGWWHRSVSVFALTPSRMLSPGASALLAAVRAHLERAT